jgi:hypothetical protein
MRMTVAFFDVWGCVPAGMDGFGDFRSRLGIIWRGCTIFVNLFYPIHQSPFLGLICAKPCCFVFQIFPAGFIQFSVINQFADILFP